jgi:CDP-diacylglycerol---glycerol-3-phosphate 3-phosphatidyltransferase
VNKSWLTWANVLTAIRLLSLAPMIMAILYQHWLIAAGLFALAVVTDIYDGKIARQLQQTSPLGGLFDHATDALVVTSGSWALAQLGYINPYLYWMIPIAFIQYVLDSKALAGVTLRMSRIGRYNGVAYYVLVGTAIGARLLQWHWLSPVIEWAAWLLVATTALSMLDRAFSLWRTKHG